MELVKPEVHLIAKTELDIESLIDYLIAIGDPVWRPDEEVSGGENLVIAAGKMCYRSWQPWDPNKPEASNPNVSRVRDNPKEYLCNILKSQHGSILEHVNMTFVCRNVSRVFTHELVRHRAGCAYSQESLRYVRLDDLRAWLPPEIAEDEEAAKMCEEKLRADEQFQKKISEHYNIAEMSNFHEKKKLTSAFRRFAPIGLSTGILFTANVRALRHMIAKRTEEGAEIEIREVFAKVADLCRKTYPLFFQDMTVDGLKREFEFDKV